MPIRSLSLRPALAVALLALGLSALIPGAAAARTVTAKLRVLTPTRVVDPGTSYVVGSQAIRTDPNADCNFGGAGGSGQRWQFEKPVVLGLLAAAARANRELRPLSVTDEFGFGLAVCGIGGVDDQPGTFWYLKRNHDELTVGADQEPVRDGDEVLIYLAPDNFPAPNPKELELRVPARTAPGDRITARVIEHGCVTDPQTFATTCGRSPAAGVTITGPGVEVTTGADGRASITVGERRRIQLIARRGEDIPSQRLAVCVGERKRDCPPARGERIFGSPGEDRIRGTRGDDVIRAGGGNDLIEIRSGGDDRVNCGAGRDTVRLAAGRGKPRLHRNCERLRRRR